jgi:UDP-N-acetylmuramoyl-L-alanyl-D-glutamate--2,6-diaminopimelate ligase
MLSLKEIQTLFPPDQSKNIELDSNKKIEFITHRKDYLNNNSAYVIFKKQTIDFEANAFLAKNNTNTEQPVLVYQHLEDISRKIAIQLNQDILSEVSFYGVTGTNGKSTTVKLISDLYNQIHNKSTCASIGTLGMNYGNSHFETYNTTPFPLDLQYCIKKAYDNGTKAVSLEVSSHGLTENRIDGLEFNQVVFTNLSHEHLDYHGNMEEYFKAKCKLIDYSLSAPIVNIDCRYMSKIVDLVESAFTYSINNPQADIYCSETQYNNDGIQTNIHYAQESQTIHLNLFGEHNLSNTLAAIATLLKEGVDFNALCAITDKLKAPIGRLETVSANKGNVFIDYAHTPDALEQSLITLKKHFPNLKLNCLFGCGGDRDRVKRPMMAKISQTYCDHTYVSSDNPRNENPISIIEEICKGFSNNKTYTVIEDRQLAIKTALDDLNELSLLIIAGKGHENWQEINNQKIPFSDHQICLQNYSKR